MSWNTVMAKLIINKQAEARKLLSIFASHKPLNKSEAERINIALESSGVEEAATRLNAGWARLLLQRVAQ